MFNLKKLLILIGFCSYFKIDTLKLGLHGSSEFMKVFASKVSIGIVLQWGLITLICFFQQIQIYSVGLRLILLHRYLLLINFW